MPQSEPESPTCTTSRGGARSGDRRVWSRRVVMRLTALALVIFCLSLLYSALAQPDTTVTIVSATTLTMQTDAASEASTGGIGALLIAFLILLVCSGLISSSETALFSLDKLDITQLRGSTRLGNRSILRLLDRANETLVTILFVNTLINIVITLVINELLLAVTPAGVWWAGLASAGIATTTIILFGEILPKLIATVNPQGVSRMMAGPLVGVSLMIAPVRVALNLILELLFRVFGIQQRPGAAEVSEEELKVMISSGEVSQVLEQDEREMIDGVFDLRRTVAAEILTPRMAVMAVPDDLDQLTMIARLKELSVSRVLVYHESLDELVGFLLVKEVLLDPRSPWRQHLREAFCVPSGIGLLDLLRSFRMQRTKMAVVVDEYGGIEGIVTLQDVLEEIVGDMYETHEHQRQDLVALAPGLWRANGSLLVADLEEELGVEFAEQHGRTVGGFVMNTLGRIPRAGDEVEQVGYVLRVESMVARRVNTVLVEQVRPADESSAEPDPAAPAAARGEGES